MRKVICLVMVAAATAGCGTRSLLGLKRPSGTASQAAAASPTEALETFMTKVRKLSTEATAARAAQTTSVETQDARLRSALAAAVFARTPESYRLVATEYWRLGIFDKAHEYLNTALSIAPQDSATLDAMARLWRDAGFPQAGLADAHRAVYFAPQSAVAHNTLGTVLQAMGRWDAARESYARAARLEPTAAYAFNNLCYAWVKAGDGNQARKACERALQLQPDFAAARNNLALAHAVNGNMPAARATFSASGDPAGALYNTGMVHLARREFANAVDAFAAAHASKPTLAVAAARARQAAAHRDGATEE